MINLNTHELAWAAGFFDGEGSCSISMGFHKQRKYRFLNPPRVSISQLDRQVLDRFKLAVANLGVVRDRTGYKEGQKIFEWYCNSSEVSQAVIALLWLYLSPIKKEQAINAFKLWNARKTKRKLLKRVHKTQAVPM